MTLTGLIFIVACLTLSQSAEWHDAGIRVSVKEMACFTNDKLYEIMKTGSETYVSCQSNRGNYPTGGTMGKAFCLFDKLNFFDGEEKMKINWDEITKAFGEYDHFVMECKDTDYDVDGGFWDTIGDWFTGEDFDYSSVDKAVGNFYNCCAKKVAKEADDLFRAYLETSCSAK